MLLEKLSLKNFRNYKEKNLSFTSGINLIYGENGVGKTSILEAIYLLSTGKSFRVPSLDPLICKGASSFLIQALFRKDATSYKLNFFYNGKEKKVTLQGTPLKRYADLLGLFPSVLYSTQDSHIISGSPSDRRRFLNMILGQTDPEYVMHFIRFMRCLKQRNALLKSRALTALTPFESMLADSGSFIMEKRRALTLFLKKHLISHAEHIAALGEDYTLAYEPSVLFSEKRDILIKTLKKKWLDEQSKDQLYGSTSSGPHRDDLGLTFNEKLAKNFASEGQKRTFLSAMKFAEYDFMKQAFSCPPILSIDDFTVHLDESRIEKLSKELLETSQVFLTAPTPVSIQGNTIKLQ